MVEESVYFAECGILPAIFLSRIFRQSASAFRIGQFSIFVEKLRKKRYSFSVTDIRRAIVLYLFRSSIHFEIVCSFKALTISRQF